MAMDSKHRVARVRGVVSHAIAAAALIHLDEAELDRLKAGVVKQAWKVARNRGITCTTRADRGVLQAESDIIAAAAFEALLTLLDEHAVQVERMGR